jgi:apoptosis-inducing factor 2
MSENRNIVVLGASAGGLSAAHYIARHTLPQLQRSKDAKYTLHLVDPSTHFWWHISAPRAIVSVKEMKNSDTFVPIMDGFKQYTGLQDSIVFHQGEAISLDTSGHTVTIKTQEGGDEILEYYALIIATGIRSPTPLTTLQGNHTKSQKALEEMNTKLASAKDIVIGGSGPVAVEIAGELGTHYKGKAKITLLAGSDKLLPILSKQRADKAQKLLESVGVTVKYKTRVESFEQSSDGKEVVKLDNGDSITTDVYIPATGVKPNTEFLPAELKQTNGYVKSNKQTLRVDDAGPRVYAVGDVAGVDKGGMLNMYNTIPVWGANFNHDLLSEAKVGSVAEKKYHFKDPESQLVPVGMKTGVGAFNGWSMPGFMVSKVKGKDYMVRMMPDITQGKKWAKA